MTDIIIATLASQEWLVLHVTFTDITCVSFLSMDWPHAVSFWAILRPKEIAEHLINQVGLFTLSAIITQIEVTSLAA